MYASNSNTGGNSTERSDYEYVLKKPHLNRPLPSENILCRQFQFLFLKNVCLDVTPSNRRILISENIDIVKILYNMKIKVGYL